MNSCPPVPLRRWALYASRSIASGVDGAGGRSRPAALGPRRRGSSSLKRPYGTKVSFTFAIDEGGAVNPKLAPYIQSSLTRTDRNAVRTGSPSDHTLLPSTGFAVSFLGTGSGGVQSVDRLSSVAALRQRLDTELAPALGSLSALQGVAKAPWPRLTLCVSSDWSTCFPLL